MLTKDKLSNCNMKGLMNQKNKAEEINIEKKLVTNKDINYKIHSQERLDSASNLELAIDSQNRNNKMSNNMNNNPNSSSYVPTAANSPTSYSSSLTSIPDDRGDVYEVLESVPNDGRIMDHDLHLLNKAIHPEPFSILGYQKFGEDSEYEYYVVRAWIRNAKSVKIKALDNSFSSIGLDNTPVEMENRHINGNNTWLFEKAFRTLKDRIPTTRTHFCGYDSNNYTKNDLKENLQGENNNNNGDNNPPYTQKKGKLTLENTTCSTDVACNYYIHDNLDSNNCLRKLYYEYLVEYINDNSGKEYKIRDTYSFGLLLSDEDIKLFQSGSCWHVDNIFGSHIIEYNGVKGVRFTVWAPNAKFVRVVGDWNSWDGRANPMRLRYGVGIWELFIPHLGPGEKYGYEIHSNLNHIFVKIDPYSQEYEIPPKYASIISSCDDSYKNKDDRFKWEDEDWMKRRKEMGIKGELRRQPISIYEVHLPSWMRKENGDYLSYREIAKRLVNHVKNLNFTYVEFLPLAQHPFEGSWGYQVTGQYAPYSRLGTPDDFKYLINELHKANIGVFMDFVPAHFCKDSWGLVYYDGTPTYEYADPREGEHKQWGTAVFNFRRNEVRSFLLGAAYHWLRRYHIDGLRIDAVSSMLYRNYLRPNGEWIPNEFGGDANLEAVSLLQELNWVIHKEFPGVFTMAEESTAWQGVTKKDGGLGFDAKWDLGWMNDTLSYLYTPPDKKSSKHNKLTFRGLYMSHESWVLPLSHDEVVNGKGSLLDKCGFTGAPYMDRIRTLKALFGYQIGIPGRPLLFQGAEIAQGREWKENRSVDWHEGEEDIRKKVCIFLSDLLGIYRSNLSLHAGDDESWNFQWVDCENSQDCIIAFLRKYKEWYNDIVVICNFSSRRYQNYPIGVPHGKEWKVLINSDDWKYGGAMFGPGNNSTVTASHGGRVGWDYCLWVDIPEFSCMYFKPNYVVPEVNNDQTKKQGLLEWSEFTEAL